MPVKSKSGRTHHVSHKKEKRTKRFLKVYAPYIPLLLIVGCGIFVTAGSELRPSQGSVKNYATDVSDAGLLEASNAQRAAQGLQPLVLNSYLDTAAQSKANDMAARNYWAHLTPDGHQPWDFIDSNYKYQKAAENLAYGFGTSQLVVNGWMNSQSHRKNLLDPELSDVGFGVINSPDFQDKGPETIVVAFYGKQSAVTPAETTTNVSDSEKNVNYIESVTGSNLPWASLALGAVIGGITMHLIIKHAKQLRRTLKRGEKFIVKHPLLDISLLALMALAVIVSQTIGKVY